MLRLLKNCWNFPVCFEGVDITIFNWHWTIQIHIRSSHSQWAASLTSWPSSLHFAPTSVSVTRPSWSNCSCTVTLRWLCNFTPLHTHTCSLKNFFRSQKEKIFLKKKKTFHVLKCLLVWGKLSTYGFSNVWLPIVAYLRFHILLSSTFLKFVSSLAFA